MVNDVEDVVVHHQILPAGQSPDGDYPLWFPAATHVVAKHDPQLKEIVERIPGLANWCQLGHRWLSRLANDILLAERAKPESKQAKHPLKIISLTVAHKIPTLQVFIENYLGQQNESGEYIRQRFWADPASLLRVDSRVADDFWGLCCAPTGKKYEYKRTGRVIDKFDTGASYSRNLKQFLDWVILTLFPVRNERNEVVANPAFKCPFRPRNAGGILVDKGLSRDKDSEFLWILEEFPTLSAWQPLAKGWIASETANIPQKIQALSKFFGTYLAESAARGTFVARELAVDPRKFLRRGAGVPDNLAQLFPEKSASKRDRINDFLDWVLLQHYSEQTDDGDYVTSPEFRNPYSRVQYKHVPGTGYSVRSPLPYGFIERLRLILVEGPHFQDWKWAQQAFVSDERGGHAVDWFPVDQSLIDKNDPDCVWRRRSVDSDEESTSSEGAYEMWSPVRWVAVLAKLIVPARTMQIRVLDSGEADTWRWDGALLASAPHCSPWILNQTNPHLRASFDLEVVKGTAARRQSAKGHQGRPLAERAAGLFQRTVEWTVSVDPANGKRTRSQVEVTKIYFNTNKTADTKKEGPAKGYSAAWPISPWPVNSGGQAPAFNSEKDLRRWQEECSRNIHYWLAKLRDWQSKYNRVDKLTTWSELVDGGVIENKTKEQLAGYTSGVFLFREPAWFGVQGKGQRETASKANLPITNAIFNRAWWVILRELQERLAKEGFKNLDGSAVRLIDKDSGVTSTTLFSPHSLRVSLITHLVLDGGASLPLVMSLVGHSRLIMTLYYTKPSGIQQMEALKASQERLDEAKAESEYRFLANASVAEIRDRAVFNDAESALAAIGVEADNRNPAGWLEMHHGLCPVGGNTSENPENKSVSGCHNGGPLIKDNANAKARRYGPVEGGARNCPNCRWFITSPAFLHALVAHWNSVEFSRCEAVQFAIKVEGELNLLLDQIYDAERSGAAQDVLTTMQRQRVVLERRYEGAMKKVADRSVTLANTERLIRRAIQVESRSENGAAGGQVLIANGGESEWAAVVESTDSELLQLSGILKDAEIYPDLDAGKAIIRTTQLLDAKLLRDGLTPYFLRLSEDLQMKAANAFLRKLAEVCNPENPTVGRRRAIELLEGNKPLASTLGLKKSELLDLVHSMEREPRVIPIRPVGTLGSS